MTLLGRLLHRVAPALLLFGLPAAGEAQWTNWMQANADGFGDPQNRSPFSMAVYGHRLYVGTFNSQSGCSVWVRSGPASNDWTAVSPNGFGSKNNRTANCMEVYGDRLYVGTDNTVGGFEVWAYDGATWTAVATGGLGNAANSGAASMTVHDGKLYVGSTWRGCVFAYDGTSWTQANVAYFGDPDNQGVRSLASYGGKLYAGTYNTFDFANLYRYDGPDPSDWTLVTNGGFGANFEEIRSLAAYDGKLYIGTSGWNIPCQVWAYDGATCVRSDTGGLRWDSARCMTVFLDKLYLGTGNDSGTPRGGQVWQYDAVSGLWTQVNQNGFGDVTYDAVHSLAGVGAHLYAGAASSDTRLNGRVFAAEAGRPACIALETNLLAFTATYGTPLVAEQYLVVSNAGDAFFTFTNICAFSPEAPGWLAVGPTSALVAASEPVRLTNAVNTAGMNAGTYYATNTLTAPDATNSPQEYIVALTVNKADQAIDFPAIPDQETTNTVGLAASAASGLDVSFAVSGPVTLTGGTNLSFTAAGVVEVRASQSGNTNWNAAQSVTNTFNVTKAGAAVALENLNQVYDGTPRVVTATTTPTGLTVDVTYAGSATAPAAAGFYAVTGTVNDALYAGLATGTLTVARANQTNDFMQIPDQRRTNVVHLSAVFSSGLPPIFTVLSGPGVIEDGTNLTFTGGGDVTVRASQAGDGNWNAAQTDVTFSVISGTILDFNGDGVTDLGVYRAADNSWHAFLSDEGELAPFEFGVPGDIRVPADYDGDGFCDVAVFRPSTATWYIYGTATGGWTPLQYGMAGDLPIPADYDGDGRFDLAVLRPSTMTWHAYGSTAGPLDPFIYGATGDRAIPADYDGDGLADPAVFRRTTATWYIDGTTVGPLVPFQFGVPGDLPVPGDYDGDGEIDIAVFRPSTATWFIYGSSAGSVAPFVYGVPGDVPLIFQRR